MHPATPTLSLISNMPKHIPGIVSIAPHVIAVLHYSGNPRGYYIEV
jgi:hypothetical protein